MARHANMQPFTGVSGATDLRNGVGWLVAQLRANFYFGRIQNGDRLPSVRELAERATISPTTALEMYKRLEEAGFVECRERSGTFLRRVGVEHYRSPRNSSIFETVGRTARRLKLLGIDPELFARNLLRYTGTTSRIDFKFGMFTSAEVMELLTAQLRSETGMEIPIVRLLPGPANEQEVREQLMGDPTIRCLVASFMFADKAIRLAEEFGLSMIVVRLGEGMRRVYGPPGSEKRYFITRDEEFAGAILKLATMVHGPQAAGQFVAASIDEHDRIAEIEREAREIYVSPLCFERAKARLDDPKRLVPLPTMIAAQTIDDLRFYYMFAPELRVA